PTGPLVVSRVQMRNHMMEIKDRDNRFWLTRPTVDKGREGNDGEGKDRELLDEIRPQATDKFEFIVTVPEPGMYAIMFTSPLDKKELERMTAAGFKQPNYPLRWETTTYLEVVDVAPASQGSSRK